MNVNNRKSGRSYRYFSNFIQSAQTKIQRFKQSHQKHMVKLAGQDVVIEPRRQAIGKKSQLDPPNLELVSTLKNIDVYDI